MNPVHRKMKQAAIALAFALAFAGPAAAAGDAHEHEHGHGAGEAKLVLDHGRKWQTDAPLRQGMENIRAVVARDVKAIHADKATPKQYEALADKVKGEVAYIVQNCKLPEDADAQLHLVIAELLAGADAMKAERRREGVERVARALNKYGEFFNHPGWRKL
jgi:hypothetical protein